MIDIPTIESIRDMGRQGLANAETQRRTGVSQPTVRKYLAMDDFSPQMPAKSRRGSVLDPRKPFIDSILEGDLHVWLKQRHSAQRIHERLLGETPCAGGYGIVKKHVRERRARMKAPETAFVGLVWAPGEAQAGSGDVDVVCRGERVRMHFFALGFPFSDMGFCQLFAGETSERVCRGLKDVFERVGGVPHRIVLDNAAGAGRKIGGKVTEAELFSGVRAAGSRRPAPTRVPATRRAASGARSAGRASICSRRCPRWTTSRRSTRRCWKDDARPHRRVRPRAGSRCRPRPVSLRRLAGMWCRMSARAGLEARARAGFRAVMPSNRTAGKFASESSAGELGFPCPVFDVTAFLALITEVNYNSIP